MKVDPLYKSTVTGVCIFSLWKSQLWKQSRILDFDWCLASLPCNKSRTLFHLDDWSKHRDTFKVKKRHHAFWEALYSQPGSPETFRCSGYSGTRTSAYLFMVRELCASKARKLGQGCKPGNNPTVLRLVFVWTRKIPKQPAHTLLSLHVTEPLGRVSWAQWGWHRSACVVECFSECFTFGLVSEAQQHLIRLNTTCL